ncbi:hypothetical protein GT348_01830 [Aristophania vespae]|uniref:HigA2-like helix-turn-helix domain-containing protein n=1 Tax=Aristophania vespae TaxID=2697033 RepID=A0A6P1NK04_9PROT|nr:XRE family transcriptional regulator [Aristophania vespae]QHI95191.1 hypothetical protein GT348_01830 [Aristophania vespae]
MSSSEEYIILPPNQLAEVMRLIKTKKMHQHDIAAKLGINQGRISELKNGKRYYLKVKRPLW